jgi:hypothetical protein
LNYCTLIGTFITFSLLENFLKDFLIFPYFCDNLPRNQLEVNEKSGVWWHSTFLASCWSTLLTESICIYYVGRFKSLSQFNGTSMKLVEEGLNFETGAHIVALL